MRCQPRADARLHDLELDADVAAILTRAGATD